MPKYDHHPWVVVLRHGLAARGVGWGWGGAARGARKSWGKSQWKKTKNGGGSVAKPSTLHVPHPVRFPLVTALDCPLFPRPDLVLSVARRSEFPQGTHTGLYWGTGASGRTLRSNPTPTVDANVVLYWGNPNT